MALRNRIRTRARAAFARLIADWRSLALCVSALMIAGALLRPAIPLPLDLHRYLFVFDITQSMNTQDYHLPGLPADRLGFARESVRQALHRLPCGSEIALGLFTTQTTHLLFEPLELCEHFPVIEDVLQHIDWRMAWSADTHVEMGLYQAIRETTRHGEGIRLLFLTDGQETPPQTVQPQFDGKPGGVKGLIIGVGGASPVTVPRYDRDNRLLGPWQNADIAKPPVSSTVYSEKVEVRTLPDEGPYLSWLDEAHLKKLSALTGLGYHRLDAPERLADLLAGPSLAERREASTDLRPWLGLTALVLLLCAHGFEGSNR